MVAKKYTLNNPVSTVPPQPDLKPFQVLRRTDGLLIIYDETRPFGDRTVYLAKKSEALESVIFRAEVMYKALNKEVSDV